MSDPTLWTLIEAADAVASKQISARELAQASIAKAEARQPDLNCFISLDADGALAEADAADAALARGDATRLPGCEAFTQRSFSGIDARRMLHGHHHGDSSCLSIAGTTAIE